jgi:transcriptional regulator with XRE-family HTH domain
MTIGERIKLRREELGFSQKELAEMAGLTNVSIGNIEKNMPCNLQSLGDICKALKLRIILLPIEDDESDEVFMVSNDELEYDVKKCVQQLDKVKRTLQDLVK